MFYACLQLRPWQPSPDNKARGVVIWPEPEIMEITVTLYKVREGAVKNQPYRPPIQFVEV